MKIKRGLPFGEFTHARNVGHVVDETGRCVFRGAWEECEGYLRACESPTPICIRCGGPDSHNFPLLPVETVTFYHRDEDVIAYAHEHCPPTMRGPNAELRERRTRQTQQEEPMPYHEFFDDEGDK